MVEKIKIFNLTNGLHIPKQVRKKVLIENKDIGKNGKIKFEDIFSARQISYSLMNELSVNISSSELFLMGLLESIILTLSKWYITQHPAYIRELINHSYNNYSSLYVDEILKKYTINFPPNIVFEKQKTAVGFLLDTTNKENAFLEMLQLYFSSQNPAYKDEKIFFDTSSISSETKWNLILPQIADFSFKGEKLNNTSFTLGDIMRKAYTENSHDLIAQIEFFFKEFGTLLEDYKQIYNFALGAYNEEHRPYFEGSGESKLPNFKDDIFLTGEEKYSDDAEWMPDVVMIAKNTLVWLDQLSKKYGKEIKTLDCIPDEELDIIKDSGFNAIWLIGIWERSIASKQIKQWAGNSEAESSAYSLKSYNISESLGGENAYNNLKSRTQIRKIRLASDMVPNHTSIDSPQLFNNPDWYMQVDYCPFPNYSFTGENLSGNSDFGIYLEDHYFDKTDAAVVFKYVNFKTNQTKYIYHGNDGTHMPWNDTAQLDYLKNEVREAIIHQIIEVAHRFPIIRFDAAMTLTKKHFHRLWYPEQGSEGDIPTRSSHGMTKDMFDIFFPTEFWREVVDRVAIEAPNTLLLAEAFWLLEGYFVRTLGMHRVYNSAFMNMLRDEENEKYREAIKLTLNFDRDILQRYVNFMSNPDEETAITQFGTDDKYFGTCLLMSTLPGLPMFAHGQIEGLKEKYGMEYSKAYWSEKENSWLIDKHKKEIFPILKKRNIFAQVENFRLYDFINEDKNNINQNVFAYSNSKGKDYALVFFNNVYENTNGYIKRSVTYKEKSIHHELITEHIGKALKLQNSPAYYIIYKDLCTGMEYIRRSSDIFKNGFDIYLGAYKYACFVDFKEIKDNEWAHYGKLCEKLNGAGTSSIEKELSQIRLGPLHKEIKKIFNKSTIEKLWKAFEDKEFAEEIAFDEIDKKLTEMLHMAAKYYANYNSDQAANVADSIFLDIEFLFNSGIMDMINTCIISKKSAFIVLLAWLFIRHLGELKYGLEDPVLASSLIDEWDLDSYIKDILVSDCPVSKCDMIKILQHIIRAEQWTDPIWTGDESMRQAILKFLLLDSTSRAIKVNKFEDVLWFNKECSEVLNEMTRLTQILITLTSNETLDIKKKKINIINKVSRRIFDACEISEYKLENLVKIAIYRKEK